jgi:hypothetical protein
MRSSAEFAKEAMQDQSLDGDEILNIRWANDDPNPVAQTREEMKSLQHVADTVNQKLQEEEPLYGYDESNQQQSYQQAGVNYEAFPNPYEPSLYPDTDAQYDSSGMINNKYGDSGQVIYNWLQSTVGLNETYSKRYKDLLVGGGYFDLDSISANLDDISLDALGISNLLHRKLLLDAAQSLRKKQQQEQQQQQQQQYNDYYSYYQYNYAVPQYMYTNAEYQGADPNLEDDGSNKSRHSTGAKAAVGAKGAAKTKGLVDYGNDDDENDASNSTDNNNSRQ